MSNTRIQIKRSSANTTPTNGSLNAGELAYSFLGDRLYIGTANSANVTEIGGNYWLNHTIYAYNKANSASATGMDYPYVNAATGSANSWANVVGAASNTWANTVGTAGNNYTISVGAASNTWANSIGTAGNNYAISIGAAANTWANSVGTAGNNYSIFLSASSNNWANTLSVADRAIANGAANSANAYTVTVGAASNTWANSIGTAGNNYTNSVGTAGNNYTIAVGAASNNYSNTTFVKLIAGSQTITGDLAITGNLTLLGNATTIISNNLVVGDSVIYLAANNYTGTDILDIGFVANYGNATAQNVHTGLIRDATTKQYYLFQGYDAELQANNQAFTMGANNSSYAILNADLVAGNLTLSGANVYPWILAAFGAANASYGSANGAANSANAYAITVGAASNTWANSIGTAGNNYTNSVGTAGNNYAISVGAASNTWANTIAQKWANTRLANVVATSGATVVTWTTTNGYTNATINLATTAVVTASYGSEATVPVYTVDGFGRLTYAANVAINASALTVGTLPVARGGTGNTSLTANGVLIGNGTGPVSTVFSSTEGHVLQVSAAGAPQYAMLDGGSF